MRIKSNGPDSPSAPDPIQELASRDFGVEYLFPIQRFVISNVLEGRHQIVVLPTGSGKSLCFQLPSRALGGPTLVIVPLLSLLADQARKIGEAGVPVSVLRGGLPADERERLFREIREGAPRLVLATPEACLVPSTVESLAACRFSHLVVDEAHCISEWGESFRPSYLELGGLADRIGVPLITAFTATASQTVTDKIKKILFADREVRLVSVSPDRPNISYAVRPTVSRIHSLERLIKGQSGADSRQCATIVFCRTRKEAELSARTLSRRIPERRMLFYHAGLAKEERGRVESWFLSSTDGVLFATSAYGMGVDKPDIRSVIHADVPPSVEAYLQETGRAGRDGGPASAVLLFSHEDGRFVSSLPDGIAKERYATMLGYARSRGACRRRLLLGMIGQEAPACSGCDVCGGGATDEPEGRREIVSFVAAHRRRFTPALSAEILKGAPTPRVLRDSLDAVRGFGALSSWERDDIEAAIGALICSGEIREIRWGPWKGRLTRVSAPC